MLDAFKSSRATYARIAEGVLGASADPKGRAEALAAIDGPLTSEFDKGNSAIEAIVAVNEADFEASTRQVSADVAAAETAVLLSLAIAIVLALVFGVTLLRAITQPLGSLNRVVNVMRSGDFTQRVHLRGRDEFGALAEGFNRMTDDLTALVSQVQQSGIQVNTSVTEIAATAKEQQATANEIAATTTEIGATSREISATSKELVRTMSDVSRVAEQSATLAGVGQVGVTQMEDTMRHVVEAAGAVNAKLATLNEKAGNISQVVTTITKVADQTNLLSLNAAIEAEKAGEYRRGFAVVATEIRRLADQTAVATYDIDQMVKAIQSAASAGVMSMDKFSEEVRRGMQVIQDVGGQLSTITTSDVRAFIAKRLKDVIVVRKAVTKTEADGSVTELTPAVTKHPSNGEINRELTALKRMFTLAMQAGKILHRPHIPMLREDNVRVGFFEPEQFASVRRHLPAELQPVITFAYITGWRIASEILPLEWRQVDFEAGLVRLDAGTTKNREGRLFKMTTELRKLLKAQEAERDRLKKAGEICRWVFFRMVAEERGGVKQPRRILRLEKTWAKACVAAGCPGRIPHDLRRTAVRNMVRAGVPERVSMKLTGHKTRSVFERYNIVSDGDLDVAASRLSEAESISMVSVTVSAKGKRHRSGGVVRRIAQ